MKNYTMREQLVYLGLSENQADVYLSLLQHGLSKASKMPQHTGLKRGLVYKVLDQLIDMGFVEKHGGEGSVAFYAPLSPTKLQQFVDTKTSQAREAQDVFDDMYGNLKSQFNLLSGKPSVQYFEGEEDVSKILDDILETDGVVYTYADIEAVEMYFSNLNNKHRKQRIEKGIIKKILLSKNKKSLAFQKKAIKESLTEVKIIDQKYMPFNGVTEIYDNKIMYLSASKIGISAILIEDSQIAKMQKFIFEALFEKSL